MEPEAYAELERLEAEHWWYRGMRAISAELLRPLERPGAPLRILDAGCGTGGNLRALAPRGAVVGLDRSPLALAHARHAQPGRVVRGDVTALPFRSEAFDLVTSFDVIYMVHDDEAALRELARVTRPGGHVLVRVAALAALRGAHDDFVHGLRRYSAPELARKLAGAGLAPLRITYANSLLLPAVFAARRIGGWLGRPGAAGRSDLRPAPGPLNALLAALLGLEARWVGSGRRLPAGVSLFALACRR
jgi:SAM-dependent methyltransferase